MVTLQSGRSTSTSRVAINLEKQLGESAEMPQLSTKRLHGADLDARAINRRPWLSTQRAKFGVGDITAFEPGTPLVLSPTGTAFTATSPEGVGDVWDSPDTTQYYSNGTPKSEAVSPITPPTAYTALDEESPVPKASKVLRAVVATSVSRTHTVVGLQSSPGRSENDGPEQLSAEDYFKPKKLFRNLTKDLQAIADANALAAQGDYVLTPNFDFEYSSDLNRFLHSKAPRSKGTPITAKVNTEIRPLDRSLKSQEVTNTPRLLPKHVAVLEQIVPYSIHTRLAQNPLLCVASLVKRPQDRCLSSRPSASIDRTIKDILRYDIQASNAKFLDHIEELVRTAMCGTHRNAALSEKRQGDLKVLLSSLSHPSTQDCSDIQAWIDAITKSKSSSGIPGPIDHVSEKAHEPAPRTPYKTASRLVARPATRGTTKSVSVTLEHSPHFSPYQPKWTKSLSVSQALREVITKPLKPTDEKPGFIYLFWDKEHFGKLKIGYTKDLKKRLKDWNQKCGRTHAYHPAIGRGELPEIPHVSRVERLIHAELKDCREERSCASCNMIHQEWFDVEDALVLKVFQKWQNWIAQNPYALDGETGEWVLRSEMMETLSQVCEPVSPELNSQPPRRDRAGKKGKLNSSRRAIGWRRVV